VIERVQRALGSSMLARWERVSHWAAIRPASKRARAFRGFGARSAICFPPAALFGERYITVGEGTVIGPYSTLSAGVSPQHELGDVEIVRIGDRCLIGKGSGIVAHERVVIGDDVFTGHHVYVTDANHGYEDVTISPGQQFAPSRPVTVGDGAWLGHGVIVLPGAVVGRHTIVGAGSVVTGVLPDFSVAVGNPARVIRHYDGTDWIDGPPNQPDAAGDG
jgi:acetyltransferase-like isoleucine patch superfamily enzyme